MKSASLVVLLLSHFGLLAQAQRATTNAKCGANGNTCLGSSQYLALDIGSSNTNEIQNGVTVARRYCPSFAIDIRQDANDSSAFSMDGAVAQ